MAAAARRANAMIGACPSPLAGPTFVRGMIAFVDCTAQSLGEGGYRAMAAPGSGMSLVVTALFTIAVALTGYHMLSGERPGLRDIVTMLAKIGFVLALTTSWPAYRTLFYDVALRTPAGLTSMIGAPLGLSGAGTLADRLQALDAALSSLENADPTGSTAMPPPPPSPAAAGGAAPPAALAVGADAAGTLRNLRLVVLVTALGSLAATRLLAGALLAVGPLFVACLLLAGTRGLFIGWLRVLGGAVLGAFGAALTLGIALSCLEPMVAALSQRPDDVAIDPDALLRLMGTGLVFAVVMVVMLAGVARVMAGLHWPWRVQVAPLPSPVAPLATPTALRDVRDLADPTRFSDRSRARATADAVSAQQRRERGDASRSRPGHAATASSRRDGADDGGISAPVGLSFRRSTRGRVSAGMTRRNAS